METLELVVMVNVKPVGVMTGFGGHLRLGVILYPVRPVRGRKISLETLVVVRFVVMTPVGVRTDFGNIRGDGPILCLVTTVTRNASVWFKADNHKT